MQEKWLNGYSNLSEEMPEQSGWSMVIALICALILLSLLCAGSMFAAAPIALPTLPTPPEHIAAVEPEMSGVNPIMRKAPSKEKEAEQLLTSPSIIEPPMPVEVAKAVDEEKEAHEAPAPMRIPAAVTNKLDELEGKVHSIEAKQVLFENELKQLRHQADQPHDKDIQYSSAPIETPKVNVPSIEEISSVEEL